MEASVDEPWETKLPAPGLGADKEEGSCGQVDNMHEDHCYVDKDTFCRGLVGVLGPAEVDLLGEDTEGENDC